MKTGKHMIVGLFFLLLGVSILMRVFFGWNIPIFRSFCAIFLIYLGVRMLVGGFSSEHWGGGWSVKDSQNVVFERGDFRYEKGGRNHYSTVFGSSVVDLTKIPADAGDVHVHIDTVFGDTRVLLPAGQPVAIRSSAVFGEAKMPNGDMVAFGTLNYKSAASGAPTLKIHGNVVFGSLKFIGATEGATAATGPSGAQSTHSDDDED